MRGLIVISLCFGLVSCTHFSMYRNEDVNFTPDAKVVSTPHYFWGLLPGRVQLVEAELCPNSRINAAQMRMSSTDVLLTIVTAGVYVPSRAMIGCSQ